jgi:ATP dependent DNA ligase domain
VVEAVNHLTVRSCLIDGEVVCADERGVSAFHVLRRRRNEALAFLFAFDLLELDGTDLRREPLEVRKATPRQYPAEEGRAGERAFGSPGGRGCLSPRLLEGFQSAPM